MPEQIDGVDIRTHLGPYEIISPSRQRRHGDRLQEPGRYRLDVSSPCRADAAGRGLGESGGGLIERFSSAREARAISRISHPHICASSMSVQAHGLHYLVMELDRRRDAGQPIARGLSAPMSDVLAIGPFRELARGVEAAHRHGIVHRDLKPGKRDATASGAKLTRLGLAKGRTRRLFANVATTDRRRGASPRKARGSARR